MASRVIDCDCHTMEPDEVWHARLEPRFRKLLPDDAAPGGGRVHTPASHLAALDTEGIDTAVLIGTRGRHLQLSDRIDPEFAAALARAQNDWTREFCEADPRRLRFAAQIGYGDPERAAREVEHAVRELGAVGVVGNPNPFAGRHLHDGFYDPLWSAIEHAGVPLCIHPSGVWTLDDDVGRRFAGHAAARSIADAARNPLESMLGLASLIVGGVLDRHPRLTCVLLECDCEWLPWWLDRLTATLERFPEDIEVELSATPAERFARQCFVATDGRERRLPEVVAAMGDRNLVFGSDYPHRDSAYPEAVSGLRSRADLSAATIAKVLGGNAERAFPALASEVPLSAGSDPRTS